MAVDKELCPECRGKMVVGFLSGYRRERATRMRLWIEGKPKPKFLTGIQLKGKDIRVVVTWRCTSCGLLRAYAEERIPPPGLFG